MYFRFFVIISSRTSLFLTLLRNGTLKCFSQKQPFFQQFQKQHKTHPYKTSTLVMELDVLINIIHTKLRHNCILDYDLFRKNKIESTKFAYGLPDDSYLFFFLYVLIILQLEMTFLDACYTLLNYLLLIVTYSYGVMKHKMTIKTSTYFPLFRKIIRNSGRLTKV